MSSIRVLQAEEVTVKCFNGEDGSRYRIWCDYCKRYHHHAPEPGYRVAHCHDPNSPYAEGYVLLTPKRPPHAREAT